MSEKVTLGLPLSKDVNDQLNKLAPHGVKSEVLRRLIKLLINKQLEMIEAGRPDYISDLVLRGRVRLEVDDD